MILKLMAAIIGERIFVGLMYQIVNRLDAREYPKGSVRRLVVDSLWWLA